MARKADDKPKGKASSAGRSGPKRKPAVKAKPKALRPDTEVLSLRQQRFVEEVLIDNNLTQAAIRAGYSPKTAGVQASRLLKNVQVARAIEERRAKVSEKAQVEASFVIIGLKEVVERCLQRKPVMVFDPVEREMVQATDEEGRGIWQFDSQGANRALELLGKHKGMFVERHKVEDDSALAILRQKLNVDAGAP